MEVPLGTFQINGEQPWSVWLSDYRLCGNHTEFEFFIPSKPYFEVDSKHLIFLNKIYEMYTFLNGLSVTVDAVVANI